MIKLLVSIVLLQGVYSQNYQKVAPGVPPQQYQAPPPQQYQPPPQQQYQQPPQQQQYQQQQQYAQQVPVQQIPVQQVPVNQVPQGGGNHAHMGDPQLLNPANMEHEREHIKEHMEVPNIDVSKMSEAELQFHYFKMHDADHNNMLDGCELIKSLIHWHAEQGHKQQQNQQQQTNSPPVGEKIFADDELINLIDPILNMDDHNKDGYIDYPEFVRAQQKSRTQNQDQGK